MNREVERRGEEERRRRGVGALPEGQCRASGGAELLCLFSSLVTCVCVSTRSIDDESLLISGGGGGTCMNICER